MEKRLKWLLLRKLMTTYVVTACISITLASLYIFKRGSGGTGYNQGNELMVWSFIYIMYAGGIILIYGNAVSIGLEIVYKKWFARHRWFYLSLHGCFGLALGLLFPNWLAAVVGMMVALGYAAVDSWLSFRIAKNKNVKLFFIIPILIYSLSWGYLQLSSPPLPPFTLEDAVRLTTSRNGTNIDAFPKEIGKWQGEIDGFQIVRETSAEKIKKGKYTITFTEYWEVDGVIKSRYNSYRVDRWSMTAYRSGGDPPPYHSNH